MGANGNKKLERTDYDNIILVVEDDDVVQKNIIKTLNDNFPNCTILTCDNGLEALKMLKKGHAHVVITNWNMKPMSGLNLLKALRFQFTKEQLPIMMLTHDQDKEDLYDFYNNGGNFFFKKPIKNDDFVEKIEKMLVLKTMVNMVEDLESIEEKIEDTIEIFEKSLVTGVAAEFSSQIESKINELESIKDFADEILEGIKEREKELAEAEAVS